MNPLGSVLPLICIAIGFYLGYNLARRGRYRPAGILLLLAGGGFWLCMTLAQSAEGAGAAGYAVMALLIILPMAGGELMGLIFGALRRRRDARRHV